MHDAGWYWPIFEWIKRCYEYNRLFFFSDKDAKKKHKKNILQHGHKTGLYGKQNKYGEWCTKLNSNTSVYTFVSAAVRVESGRWKVSRYKSNFFSIDSEFVNCNVLLMFTLSTVDQTHRCNSGRMSRVSSDLSAHQVLCQPRCNVWVARP